MQNALFFFLLFFVKMYCILNVLLVRKNNKLFFLCFPFTNELCSLFGGGEGSSRLWGTGRKGGDGHISLDGASPAIPSSVFSLPVCAPVFWGVPETQIGRFVPLGFVLTAPGAFHKPCRNTPRPQHGLACGIFKGKKEINRNILNSWRQE